MLVAIVALALGLRLLVWRWHAQYPLGGDEREYFDQALTLLRERRYQDMLLMRPPLYTFFLAGCIYLFDSLVQRLRLVQAIVGALTVVPVYLLTRQLFAGRRVAVIAAGLAALNYTLAASATELLTETLFVFGLATLLWLLLKTNGQRDERPMTDAENAQGFLVGGRWLVVGALLAGLCLGALVLVRSVALPLLPLSALWLLRGWDVRFWAVDRGEATTYRKAALIRRAAWFVLGAAIVIGPWTLRNYLTYGAPILVDTTGAENLWLDNNPVGATPADPLGREAAKRQLYVLGDDRAARQRLAVARATAAIASHPGWFLQKVWGEATTFFALQYFDDLRQRRAIWVPPLEVWLRLLLGDAMWLALLLGGAAGLWRYQEHARARRRSDARWVLVPWALYTLLTSLIFHVELRYRLPLYPALLPYAAWSLARIGGWRPAARARLLAPAQRFTLRPRSVYAGLTILALLGMTLMHRPYIGEAWMLARKHAWLRQAERAIAAGDGSAAATAARAALSLDAESALARVALARADLRAGDRRSARAALDQAIAVLPAHPHAHLLRGALLREQGNTGTARREFAYEQASLQDLQRWSWQALDPLDIAMPAVDVGGGLDLGAVRGFHLPEGDRFRWSTAQAEVLLRAPHAPGARLDLRLNAGRPAGAPLPQVTIGLNGRAIFQATLSNTWRTYSFAIPAQPPDSRRIVATIQADTFRPRDFDRTSADGRTLGVMVGRIEVVAP